MRLWLISLFTFISSSVVAQTELEASVQYEGNTQIIISEIGISFTIPEGWSGGVPAEASFMVMTDATGEGTMILISSETTDSEINSELQSKIQLDEGIYIQPESVVKRDGLVWSGNYQVIGLPQEMKGYLEAQLGDYGIALACITIATPGAIQRAKNAANLLMRSLTFAKPQRQIEEAATASSQNDGQSWSEYLKQKSLKYFYTQSDFSESDFIYLCPDGNFTRKTRTSSGGITGSGTLYGSYAGRWQASGVGESGTLTLFNDDGSNTQFNIYFGQGNKGTGIYLNGNRFYAELTNECY